MRKRINHAVGKISRGERDNTPRGGGGRGANATTGDPDHSRRTSARINKCVTAHSEQQIRSALAKQRLATEDPMSAPHLCQLAASSSTGSTGAGIINAAENPARSPRGAGPALENEREGDRVTLSPLSPIPSGVSSSGYSGYGGRDTRRRAREVRRRCFAGAHTRRPAQKRREANT